MKSKHNSKTILNRVVNLAKQYKDTLVGKTFLVLYEGHSVELLFKTENFLHLCGIDSVLYAKDFYRKAVKGQLQSTEISFSSVHPYVFADIKTSYLAQAFSIFTKDSLVITNISTSTRSFKLGTTDLEIVFCFDVQYDNTGKIINDVLIPYSLRIENIANNKFNQMFEVDYVLSKPTGAKQYSTIEFGDKMKLEQYLKDKNINEYSINL